MPLSNYVTLRKCETKESLRIILWLLAVCAIGFVLVAYSPVEMLFSYFGYQDTNGCTLYTLFGFPCPTCGMGRSLKAMLGLDFSEMFYYNPSAVFIYLLTFLIIASVFIPAVFKYKIKLTSRLLRLWYIPVLLLIIVWVLNILLGHHEHL
jgi:hypothetical protein